MTSLEDSGSITIDVTLRDGGYLNDWRFTLDEMHRVVTAMDAAGLDYTEVGYLGGSEDDGLAARCPVDVLADLRSGLSRTALAVMLRPVVAEAPALLEPRAEQVSLVRIPTVVADPQPAIDCARIAKSLGMDTSTNLTNVSAFPPSTLSRALERVAESGVVSCIYLADSRGAMRPGDVVEAVSLARGVWQGRLGFHAHDNLGLALENSLVAVEHGCDMIDGSLGGYGIGGQNTDLLPLLSKLLARGLFRGELAPVQTLADELTLPMPPEAAELYRLAGEKNIKQEWVPPLSERLGAQAGATLRALPARRYLSIEEMWSAASEPPVGVEGAVPAGDRR